MGKSEKVEDSKFDELKKQVENLQRSQEFEHFEKDSIRMKENEIELLHAKIDQLQKSKEENTQDVLQEGKITKGYE